MFDPSKEAALARRYEAAAERGFFRCLKELRQLKKDEQATCAGVADETVRATLASFFQIEKQAAEIGAMHSAPAPMASSQPSKRFEPTSVTPIDRIFDVPITIGRPR